MDERAAAERWARVERLFDEALTLPPPLRAELLARHARNDDRLVQDVQALLDQIQTRGDLLDRAAAQNIVGKHAAPSLAMGTRVGPWRVLGFVGLGGMGEVYQAERCDGQFQQAAALKFIRREAVDQLDRFHEERRLLARLDHPGIARLIDGGLSEDGRPWMAMEWVEGVSITDWCRDHEAGLRQRLGVFLQVCEAVAYAHRNLLVHRDLKPGNVLVSAEGRSKLLDFGVAKLLTSGADETRTQAPITLAYAAPEQLAQGPITPATDVYALGLLLFEMLTGQRPWHRPEMSLPMLIDRQLRDPAPAPSASAARLHAAPIPPRQIRGDLDAITGCALRPEPERRYRSAAELADDVYRYLDAQPVVARPESFAYSLHRFVRRNPLATAFAGVAILALVAGLAASLWQAGEAQRAAQAAAREAARATATRDFLIGVFRASDPRIAQDKPRGQITAKELLDLNAPKISQDFENDPETKIELLGVAASIYRELGEESQSRGFREQQIEIARRLQGDLHPAVIDALIEDARRANDRNDYAQTFRLLQQLDPLIRAAGLDRSATRARWWMLGDDMLWQAESAEDPFADGHARAARLFEEFAPHDPDYVHVLNQMAYHRGKTDPAAAEQLYLRAIAIAEANEGPDDAELQHQTYPALATVLEDQGKYAEAIAAFERGAELARKTYGETHDTTWVPTAEHAQTLHRYGYRERAHRLFDRMLTIIPPDWDQNSYDEYAREFYASCLAAEGRADEAIPLLEAALRRYIAKPGVEYEQRRNRLILGDAYDRVGRSREAYEAIKSSLDERIANEPADGSTVLVARERFARLLITQGDLDGAQSQFDEILARWSGLNDSIRAMTQGDLARLALRRGDVHAAVESSRTAVETYEHLTGRRHVRNGPYLWLIHAESLRLSGDARSASEWAQRALDASVRYDHPSAPSIAEAQIVLANCHLDLGDADKARTLAHEAGVIHAAHKDLSEQYRQPLRALQERLSATDAHRGGRTGGDRAKALPVAARALEASRRYDHPEAASIRQARMAVAAPSWP